MIILFEGARCTGKTTLSQGLATELKAEGFPAEWWKVERGEDPFEDMMATLQSDFEDRNKLWVVDRFHLTEYVNSFVTGRALDKEDLWRKTALIDCLLCSRDAFLVFMMASSDVRRQRLKDEDREEHVVPTYMNALWMDTARRSVLPKVGIFSNAGDDMSQARYFLLTFAKAHWDRIHFVP